MMRRWSLPKTHAFVCAGVGALALLAGCVSDAPTLRASSDGGGDTNSGGATSSGGAGGTPASGGTTSSGGASSGGTTSSGGASSGGTTATGGASSGGTTASGGASSGGTATGGASSGGTTATGGASSGGTTAAGGTTSSGGTTATGGTTSSGGTSATGGTGGTTSTYCTQQKLPTGVLAADYQCVDFEKGLPSSTIWVPTSTGSGSLTRSMAKASSLPYSILTSVTAVSDGSNPDTATLSWNDVGASAITKVSLAVALNPPPDNSIVPAWSGDMTLLCIATGSNQTCLTYTVNGSTLFSNDYTGFYVSWVYSGGAAVRDDCAISTTTTLKPNLWNNVSLDVTLATGAIQFFIGAAEVTSSCSGGFGNDTVAKVTVGPTTQGTTTSSWSGYIDNIVAAVSR